jgi:Outer membrane protein beta-barrel domain
MKKLLLPFIFFAAGLAAAPSAAHADLGASWFGANFEVLPSGTYTASGNIGGATGSTTGDLEPAYAIDLLAEVQGNGLLSIGLAPRYIFNGKVKDSNGDAYTQLDLRGRVTVGPSLMGHKLRAYGFAEPGWSIIFPPKSSAFHDNNNDNTVHPNGFVLGVGGGVAYNVTAKIRAVFELGYQWGFQTWSYNAPIIGNINGDFKDNYLQIGFGAQFAVD